MTKYLIDDDTAYKDFKDYLREKPKILSVKGNVITTEDFSVEVLEPYEKLLDEIIVEGESLKERYVRTQVRPFLPDKVVMYNSDTTEGVIENAGYKFKTY